MMRLMKVSKDYGSLKALDNINVRIDEGDFIIIEGQSGCGKSTLLKTMGGLLRSDKGKIYYGQDNIVSYSEDKLAYWRRTNIGFIFQQFFLIDYLTALENVSLPMLYLGRKKEESIIRSKKLLRLVGLENWEDHLPDKLSGGQAQRVAVARSLANAPKLILCDEPTGALDKKSAYEVMELLKLFNKHGKTIVLVTHDTSLEKYGNKIWHMEKGRIIDA